MKKNKINNIRFIMITTQITDEEFDVIKMTIDRLIDIFNEDKKNKDKNRGQI